MYNVIILKISHLPFLSNDDVLCSSKLGKEYYGQLMLKFFKAKEELPEYQPEQIKNHKFDEVTKQYNHNYGNCILSCTYKKKSN